MLIKIAVLLPVKVKKLCAFFFKIFQTLCQHNLRGSTHFLLSLCPLTSKFVPTCLISFVMINLYL